MKLRLALAAVIAAALIGGMLLVPASAHITPNVAHTFKHIQNRLGYEVVRTDFAVDAGAFVRDISKCPKGKEAVGGGAQVVGEGTANFATTIQESAPGTTGSGGGQRSVWLVSLVNNDTVTHTIGIFAVCANMKAP